MLVVAHASRTRVHGLIKAFKGVGHYVRLDINGLDAVSGNPGDGVLNSKLSSSVDSNAVNEGHASYCMSNDPCKYRHGA
jgi:hypothetical protein